MNWVLLGNSLLVAGGAALAASLLGFTAALAQTGLAPVPARAVWLVAVLTAALPPFLAVNSWLHYLGAAGVWRPWFDLNLMSPAGTIWVLSLLLWPWPFLAVRSAWTRLEPAQLEADPGLAGGGLVRHLLLPLAAAALAPAAALVFVLALGNFAVPAILQVKVFPAEMWIRFNTQFDTAGALRASWPLILAPLLLLAWLARRELPWPRRTGGVPPVLFRRQLGRAWFVPAVGLTALLAVLSLGLPLWQLAASPRTWTELPGALAAGRGSVWASLWLAGAAATAVLAASLPAARRRPGRLLRLLAWLVWIPLLVPGVLTGIALIAMFNRDWSQSFYQSAWMVVFAFSLRYLALGWHAMSQAARGLDAGLVDAARMEGAGPWRMLQLIWIPQAGARLATAWFVVFLLCLWDVESMVLITPPGCETLALRIFNLLHYGHNPQVNALCLTLLGLAAAPLLAVWLLARTGGAIFRRRLAPAATAGMLLLAVAGCSRAPSGDEIALPGRIFSRARVQGTRGVGIGQFNKPRSVTVDRADNLYVVDMTGRVQKFSPRGDFLLFWQMPETALGHPKGLGLDEDGNVIVVEPHYQRINHYSVSGRLLEQWGHKGTNEGQLSMPRGIAINSRHEALVPEFGVVERIQRFDLATIRTAIQQASAATNQEAPPSPFPQPKFRESFGRPGQAPGELNRPEGICVDAQDRIYVADSCNHRIQIFSPDGKFLRAYGKPGSGMGELSYPYDIRVDAAGRQYVCEFGNSRIQVFDANDRPLEIIGGPGAGPGRFNNPWSIALDSAGNLYVADSQNHRVQKLLHAGAPPS